MKIFDKELQYIPVRRRCDTIHEFVRIEHGSSISYYIQCGYLTENVLPLSYEGEELLQEWEEHQTSANPGEYLFQFNEPISKPKYIIEIYDGDEMWFIAGYVDLNEARYDLTHDFKNYEKSYTVILKENNAYSSDYLKGVFNREPLIITGVQTTINGHKINIELNQHEEIITYDEYVDFIHNIRHEFNLPIDSKITTLSFFNKDKYDIDIINYPSGDYLHQFIY